MKAVLVLCLFGLAIVAAKYTHGHNGRPGCVKDVELLRPWRNNFDPTRYWVCVNRGQPGTAILCPESKVFYERVFACVDWSQWEWTPPYDPPTLG